LGFRERLYDWRSIWSVIVQRFALPLAEKIRGDLQSKLEGAIRNRDVIGDFDTVFRSALDRLSGKES